MPRYFIELSYKGTNYSGFQKQENSNSIQAEVEKAFSTFFRKPFELTGSSRTDAGVHALQNYFHVDVEIAASILQSGIYHLNAILPPDITIQSIKQVKAEAHCRFDACHRLYRYRIYRRKDPFLQDTAYFFPYKLNEDILQLCAAELQSHTDFESFSKRNSQVFTYNCDIQHSQWSQEDGLLIYNVQANRFLRGMVKGLVGTMLRMATKDQPLSAFTNIIMGKDCSKVDFTPASQGLFLCEVGFPEAIYI